MKKYYAEVRFSFGVYSFYTYCSNFSDGDLVLCKVKEFFQIGTFIKYVNHKMMGVTYKPIIAGIDGLIDDFNEVEQDFENQKPKLEPYDYNKTYKDGDRIIHLDHVWKFDGKYQSFFTECTIEEWEKQCC